MAAEAIVFGLLFRQTSMTYTYCVTQFMYVYLILFFSFDGTHVDRKYSLNKNHVHSSASFRREKKNTRIHCCQHWPNHKIADAWVFRSNNCLIHPSPTLLNQQRDTFSRIYFNFVDGCDVMVVVVVKANNHRCKQYTSMHVRICEIWGDFFLLFKSMRTLNEADIKSTTIPNFD